MKISSNLKTLGLGLIGGLLPLGVYLTASETNVPHSDQVVGNSQNDYAKRVSLNNAPANATSFVTASESTLNSVVHITTKVEKTNFQRMFFLSSFMDQELAVESSNNLDKVRDRA